MTLDIVVFSDGELRGYQGTREVFVARSWVAFRAMINGIMHNWLDGYSIITVHSND